MSEKTRRFGSDGGDGSGLVDSGLEDTHVAAEEQLAKARPSSEHPPLGGAESTLTGRKLHHFEVGELLGEGGMGAVYRGHDLSLDRPVAIKVIARALASAAPIRERFVREARAQAKLNHAAVVPIYYIGEQDGLWFFAMELVEGASLAELTTGRPLPADEAIELLCEIASALRLARARGIVHRDLKPSNLLIDSEGHVKVADFGLAKAVRPGGPAADDSAGGSLTAKGEILGTPLYMSPEQAQGDPTDHRSDIYSLGATFYHLVCGRPAFVADTPMAIVVQHCTKPPPPVREVNPTVPPRLAAVLERMLAKMPRDRYQDYDALLTDLEAARPRQATVAGFWARSIAWLLDLVPLVLLSLFGKLGQLLFAAYCIGCWWRWGATFGKWLLRLKVERADGGQLGIGRATVRFAVLFGPLIAGSLLGGLAAWLGQGKVPLNNETTLEQLGPAIPFIAAAVLLVLVGVAHLVLIMLRRGLHDRVAATRVVYRLAEPPGRSSRGLVRSALGERSLAASQRSGAKRSSAKNEPKATPQSG
jgi:uncharacterized RDD family membrane protein YckC/predicted Ser/Thr protein kinase